MLDIWPALPLQVVVTSEDYDTLDNIIAALERSDRVCQIDMWGPVFPLKEDLAAMQEPFPELRLLTLHSYETVAVLPDSFLGGYTPRLERVCFNRISFPGLPKLLLSATHLITLSLYNTPFRIHVTRDDGHQPLRVDQSRAPFACIPIPSISP
jgi:hypothetical protein